MPIVLIGHMTWSHQETKKIWTFEDSPPEPISTIVCVGSTLLILDLVSFVTLKINGLSLWGVLGVNFI